MFLMVFLRIESLAFGSLDFFLFSLSHSPVSENWLIGQGQKRGGQRGHQEGFARRDVWPGGMTDPFGVLIVAEI